MRIDLLHLARNLRRSPVSAAVSVLTLSLTLGAAASIFAVLDAVVLTPPPFADHERLVTIGEVPLDDPTAAPRAVGYATFEAWRERASALAMLEASDGTNLTLTELGAAERVNASNVTPGFLALLGVAPMLGRSLGPDDVGQPVVIISHTFWRGKLASDPQVIGRRLVLGNQAHTIVGVLPERFASALIGRDIWRPFPVTPGEAVRSGYRVYAMARLASQASAADVAAALNEVSQRSSPAARVVATPIATAIAGDVTPLLTVLAGAAGLAIVIAFANLAGLLIVRSIDRQHELAVRSALGARRADIVRQLLLEAQVLVVAGIVGGVLLAAWITPVVARLALEQFGDLARREVAVQWRVIAVMSIVASVCALICGLLPAFAAARRSVIEVLRRGATPPPRERHLRRVFVTAEVALAFVLLVSVALLGRSLVAMLAVNPGFDPRGVRALSVSLPAATYSSGERVAAFYSALQRALEERLGPRAVSIIDEIPLTGDRGRTLVSVRSTDIAREAVMRSAAESYFDVMRIPIVAGRSFHASDDASAPVRVVVSESLAESLSPSEPPIGRRVFLARIAREAEIIGVAGDVKHRSLDEGRVPTVYLSALQAPSHSNILVVRPSTALRASAWSEADVIAAVRDEVARLDRELPVYSVRSMTDIVSASPGVPVRRVLTAAFLGFAVLAVVLGVLGLFGVVAHDVASRRAELALRIALGAHPRGILTATLQQGALIIGSGLLVGSVLSTWTTRVLTSVIVGADRVDVLSIGIAAAVLVAAGAAAVFPSALRAARTDPLAALRAE